jgi:two-component system response regulator PilR (NtrC family)
MVTPALAGKSILIVEDEPQLRSLLEAYLKRLGPHVLSAPDVSSARRILQADAGQVDILLTDSQLPDGNGQDLAREFLAATSNTVAILSSGIPIEISEWEIASGRLLLLEKPYAPRELLALLEQLIPGSDSPSAPA